MRDRKERERDGGKKEKEALGGEAERGRSGSKRGGRERER